MKIRVKLKNGNLYYSDYDHVNNTPDKRFMLANETTAVALSEIESISCEMVSV
jgi:uncharacterized membrane protein YidH (DUF202 family)